MLTVVSVLLLLISYFICIIPFTTYRSNDHSLPLPAQLVALLSNQQIDKNRYSMIGSFAVESNKIVLVHRKEAVFQESRSIRFEVYIPVCRSSSRQNPHDHNIHSVFEDDQDVLNCQNGIALLLTFSSEAVWNCFLSTYSQTEYLSLSDTGQSATFQSPAKMKIDLAQTITQSSSRETVAKEGKDILVLRENDIVLNFEGFNVMDEGVKCTKLGFSPNFVKSIFTQIVTIVKHWRESTALKLVSKNQRCNIALIR